MNIETQHVSLVEIAVPVRRLSPVVIPNLLPYFSGLSADRHEPVVTPLSKPDIFERVPEILTIGSISKKTPVLVLPQQLEAPVRDVRLGSRYGLGPGRGCCENQRNGQHGEKSYQGVCSTSVRFGGDRMDLRNVAAWKLHNGTASLIG